MSVEFASEIRTESEYHRAHVQENPGPGQVRDPRGLLPAATEGHMHSQKAPAVRGHEKVPTGGHVEVPTLELI
jgi:hypothetical protein